MKKYWLESDTTVVEFQVELENHRALIIEYIACGDSVVESRTLTPHSIGEARIAWKDYVVLGFYETDRNSHFFYENGENNS
jgi:hypothetical protein